jgi:hypothetical protein
MRRFHKALVAAGAALAVLVSFVALTPAGPALAQGVTFWSP